MQYQCGAWAYKFGNLLWQYKYEGEREKLKAKENGINEAIQRRMTLVVHNMKQHIIRSNQKLFPHIKQLLFAM